jgi:protease-4
MLVAVVFAPRVACEASELAPFLEFEQATAHLPSTPSVTGGAAAALVNPAAWSLSGPTSEMAFWWSDRHLDDGPKDYGLSVGRNLGFAMKRTPVSFEGRTRGSYDLQAGLSFGNRAHHVGLAWRWPGGVGRSVGRENGFVVGTVTRPNRFVSYGSSAFLSTESSRKEGSIDAGVRPFGRPICTLFGSFALTDDQTLDEGRWKSGLEIRPIRGFRFGASYSGGGREDEERFGVHVGLTLDELAADVIPGYDQDGHHDRTTMLVRHAPPHRGIPLARWMRGHVGPPRYASIDLENKRLVHRKARYFDNKNVAWIDLLDVLKRALEDPGIRGIALNLASFDVKSAMAWELRTKLEEFRARGKEVLIHTDRPGFIGYYLASVADRLTLDPDGMVFLPGVIVQRTYWRGTLDKLGIGFQELRFFTHKTAAETFSRTEMSDADREQLQRVVDVKYEEVRAAVTKDRSLSVGEFDSCVDEDIVLLPPRALERRLVDGVARWHELPEWLERERGGAKLVAVGRDLDRGKTDERWGLPPRIALVHAIGICAMDQGIDGRGTSHYLRSLETRSDIAGVVLRADSPGGEHLPSDLLAEATRRLRDREKPVIVSQSGVAASGGYWISMNGTRILTTPFTLTGSIGVIGGWFWDDGFGRKTGFTSDGVKRGAHADIFDGTRVPYAPVALPTRPLTDIEIGLVEGRFRTVYDEFVGRVAAGRGLSEERVREIGEGRVWMGADAITRGLCDELGTLEDAITIAKNEAGLSDDEEVEIIEYPRRRLFPPFQLIPALPIASLVERAYVSVSGLWGSPEGEGDRDSTLPTEPIELAPIRGLLDAPLTPQLLVSPSVLPLVSQEPAE